MFFATIILKQRFLKKSFNYNCDKLENQRCLCESRTDQHAIKQYNINIYRAFD